jgi:hypothetical protein
MSSGLASEHPCPQCRTTLRAADERAGQVARCPRCGHRFAWLGTPSASQQLALPPGASPLNQLAFGADRLIFVYALVVGWLCIYVPWSARGRYREAVGYGFLWSPPEWAGRIDIVRLVLEVVAATAALVALAVWREHRRRRRLQSKPISASRPIWPRLKSATWGSLLMPRWDFRAWRSLLMPIVIVLGVAAVAQILIAIASLFSGGR